MYLSSKSDIINKKLRSQEEEVKRQSNWTVLHSMSSTIKQDYAALLQERISFNFLAGRQNFSTLMRACVGVME